MSRACFALSETFASAICSKTACRCGSTSALGVCITGLSLRRSISLQPVPAGKQPDSDLDQPNVQFRVGDGARPRHRKFRPAAERHAERRSDHRPGRVAQRLEQALQLARDGVDLVPLALLGQHQDQENVRARR